MASILVAGLVHLDQFIGDVAFLRNTIVQSVDRKAPFRISFN